MNNLKVKFHLRKNGRLIYIEDILSDEIMNRATSVLIVKPMYCEEKGYRTKDLEGWEICEPEEEE